jgi:hypothetical protein
MAKTYIINPILYHYAGLGTVFLAFVLGLGRYAVFGVSHFNVSILALSVPPCLLYIDSYDSSRCTALMTRGSWLDSARQQWQPDGSS